MNEELQKQERHGPRMLDSVPDAGPGAGAGPSTVIDKFVHQSEPHDSPGWGVGQGDGGSNEQFDK
jgi:hypothetical protein